MERNTNVWLPSPGTWLATQACALTGNQTYVPLVHRWVLSPLSHTSQDRFFFISLTVTFIFAWVFFMLLKYPMSPFSILITSVLNSSSDKLLISILFSSFSGVFFCSLIWAMFPCLFILAAFPCLFLCIRKTCFESLS